MLTRFKVIEIFGGCLDGLLIIISIISKSISDITTKDNTYKFYFAYLQFQK